MESINEDIEDPSLKRDVPVTHLVVQVKREEVKEQVDEDMLDDVVDVYLTEMDTVTLLDMPGVSVSVDAEDAESVRERNLAYVELCKNRTGNDKYMERPTQTFNGVAKTKVIQTDKVHMVDAGTMATAWDMYDSCCSAEQGEAPPTSDPMVDKLGLSEDAATAADPGEPEKKTMSLVNINSLGPCRPLEEDDPDPALILHSKSFQHSLLAMERNILANIYQSRLAAYRQLPALALQDRDAGVAKPKTEAHSGVRREESSPSPVLELLWTYSCKLTTGHQVSCMAWNKKNQDLLAVGYGHSEDHTGLVCGWSLKNITWPERVLRCQSAVSALDFSASQPSLLAAGLQDGHLMKLKRVPVERKGPRVERQSKQEELISKLTPGLCFHFHPQESNIYLVGTQEGHIHLCSSLNHEQYLETYQAHQVGAPHRDRETYQAHQVGAPHRDRETYQAHQVGAPHRDRETYQAHQVGASHGETQRPTRMTR
ncbi:hypothetical protein CRUP_011510 [Coryphaenoides rupestris]|nr:hypothetical protein CRUP_011510 [Coryphaenoides rupestris]